MNAKHLISLCAAVGAISLIGCQSTETASTSHQSTNSQSRSYKKADMKTLSSTSSTSTKTIECSRMINNVIAGKNYAGQEFIVYGVALNATKSGRVNVGTRAMYQAGQFENFVSVYDVPEFVKPGTLVQFNVKIDSTHTGMLPNGSSFVVVDAEYID